MEQPHLSRGAEKLHGLLVLQHPRTQGRMQMEAHGVIHIARIDCLGSRRDEAILALQPIPLGRQEEAAGVDETELTGVTVVAGFDRDAIFRRLPLEAHLAGAADDAAIEPALDLRALGEMAGRGVGDGQGRMGRR